MNPKHTEQERKNQAKNRTQKQSKSQYRNRDKTQKKNTEGGRKKPKSIGESEINPAIVFILAEEERHWTKDR